MKQRLSTEPLLQKLLTQYVSLDLKTSDPDFRLWISKFPPTGNGIPMVFIVSAEGEVIYNRSGAPQGDGLVKLLEKGIEATGGPKEIPTAESDALAKKRAKLLATAKRLLARGETPAAVTALASIVSEDGPVDEATEELLAQINEEVAKGIAQAKVRADEDLFLATVGLAKVSRKYGELPSAKEALEAAVAELAQGVESETWRQAQMIDQAREQDEDGKRGAAVAGYRKVIEAFPETHAAALSQRRLDALWERTFQDSTGKHKIQARVVSSDDKAVRLLKSDGKQVEVQIGILDGESQAYLADRAKHLAARQK